MIAVGMPSAHGEDDEDNLQREDHSDDERSQDGDGDIVEQGIMGILQCLHERGPGAVRQVRLPTYRNEFSSGVKPILALRPIPNGLRRRSTAITLRGAKSVKNLPTRITTEWRRCWDCESSPSRGPATDKR